MVLVLGLTFRPLFLIFLADFLFFSWKLKAACLDVILSPLPRGFHLAFWEEDLTVFLLYSTVAMRRKISRKSRVFCHTPYSLCPTQMKYDTWWAWEENQASTIVFLVLTAPPNYLVYLSISFISVLPTILQATWRQVYSSQYPQHVNTYTIL